MCKYFLFTGEIEKGMELVRHSIDCLLIPDYRTQPFRVLLWKYSEATTFFAFYSISLSLIDLRGMALYGIALHDITLCP